MKIRTVLAAFAVLLALPAPAFAYVGPGAGLSLLGALWGMLLAIGAALTFALAWPVKRFLRLRRERRDARLHGTERAGEA
jgi:membrane protein implicated in regulation of membrane protease activity